MDEIDDKFKKELQELIKSVHEDVRGENSIRGVISTYLHKIDEVKSCAEVFSPVALSVETDNQNIRKEKIDQLLISLKKDYFKKDSNEIEYDEMLDFFYEFFHKNEILKRHVKINQSTILRKSLFFNLFSIFDAFIGDLLVYIYNNKFELQKSINRTFVLNDILHLEDIKQIKEYIIEKDIESLRRESYIEQFKTLENKFNLKLREFNNWPNFIEISQRRNVLMHCNGVVSQQYIDICKDVKFCIGNIKYRDSIDVDDEYLFFSILIFQEIVFKLGQTLWRKLFPSEIEIADQFLHNMQFEMLLCENYKFAEIIGEYGFNLKNVHDEVTKKLIIINYALALKYSGKSDQAIDLISNHDFSASTIDIKMACEVILGNYDKAFKYLEAIGPNGEYISEKAYLIWPLFKDIRKDSRFSDLYFKFYKKDFAKQLHDDLVKYLI